MTQPACKHCGEPIQFLAHISTPCLQWTHASGHYGCNKATPSHSVTYAEPAEVSAMKRYQSTILYIIAVLACIAAIVALERIK